MYEIISSKQKFHNALSAICMLTSRITLKLYHGSSSESRPLALRRFGCALLSIQIIRNIPSQNCTLSQVPLAPLQEAYKGICITELSVIFNLPGICQGGLRAALQVLMATLLVDSKQYGSSAHHEQCSIKFATRTSNSTNEMRLR